MTRLTQDDVARLLEEPSSERRAETVSKVIAVFDRRDLKPSERTLAEEIFRVMLRDHEVSVRLALSEGLKDNPEVPHDIALTLARDVAEVAVPMLHYSIVFTDDDLIEMVRNRPPPCQVAIAGRASVSPAVSDALVETGNEEAVVTLMHNDGAEIADETYGKVIDFFSGNEVVMTSVVERPSLPVKFAERLVTLVSEHLRMHLVQNGKLPPEVAERLIMQSREKVTVELVSSGVPEIEVADLVRQLQAKERLTPSVILRALCIGNFLFFEMAMSRLADVPLENARALIHDEGRIGLASLCARAGMPELMHEIARDAIDVAQQMGYAGDTENRETYRRRLIARFDGTFVGLNPQNLESLLGRFIRASAAPQPLSKSPPQAAEGGALAS